MGEGGVVACTWGGGGKGEWRNVLYLTMVSYPGWITSPLRDNKLVRANKELTDCLNASILKQELGSLPQKWTYNA